ncbi:MAG: hypothetical protein AAGK37_10990 [Pseudomonadota bacterium]
MRAARQLVAEIDLWKQVWQQVETFVDRIDGARDADDTAARRCLALLKAATVVERERGVRVTDNVLGDPVIDEAPRPALSDGWKPDHRIWRLPGNDELELAVANLAPEEFFPLVFPDPEPVDLLPPRSYFSYTVLASDPRYDEINDGLITVRVPSYPGRGDATIAGLSRPAIGSTLGGDTLLPGIEEDGGIVSLFPPDNRGKAATDVDQSQDWVLTWTALAGARRSNLQGAPAGDVKIFSPLIQALPWSQARVARAFSLADEARDWLPPGTAPGLSGEADEIANSAKSAAHAVTENATLLRDAKDILEDTGTTDPDLSSLIATAADMQGGNPTLFEAIETAARALAAAIAESSSGPLGSPPNSARTDAADTLTEAVSALLAATLSASDLYTQAVEEGPIGAELDGAVASRIGYPDGSLRMLRALEIAFVRFWPSRMRWMTWRHRLALKALFDAFRAPFLKGLGALLGGGDTGFPVSGLTISTAAATRSDKLRLDHPASLASALRGIEAGHVVLTTEGRAAAAVVLGLSSERGRLTFDIAPLRVSITADPGGGAADTRGQIQGGQDIATFVPGSGLTLDALRLGAHPSAPRADGPIETAVILYGQLALLFGWRSVETGLGKGLFPSYAARSLPDPSEDPLEDLPLYGVVPVGTASLVIRGAPETFWDRTEPSDPEPRMARPGERLLMRGRSPVSDSGGQGTLRQSVIEVDQVYPTTAKAFHRMDAASVALLSTAPLPSEDIDTCLADCEPEEHLIVIVLAQNGQRVDYVSDCTLRRDFQGFDLPSLATGVLLPENVVSSVTGEAQGGPEGVDRSEEFAAAMTLFADWTRFARQ